LLEIAHRITGFAEGWFEGEQFHVVSALGLKALIDEILQASFESLDRTDDKAPPLKVSFSNASLRLDWWRDDFSGGAIFKTWAGQQKIEAIVSNLMENSKLAMERENVTANILHCTVATEDIPLYFNSVTGSHSNSIDVGYALDVLRGNK